MERWSYLFRKLRTMSMALDKQNNSWEIEIEFFFHAQHPRKTWVICTIFTKRWNTDGLYFGHTCKIWIRTAHKSHHTRHIWYFIYIAPEYTTILSSQWKKSGENRLFFGQWLLNRLFYQYIIFILTFLTHLNYLESWKGIKILQRIQKEASTRWKGN